MTPAAAALRRIPSSIQLSVEPSLLRFTIAVDGWVDGPAVADAFAELYRDLPELTGLDILFEITRYSGGFNHWDLLKIVRAFEAAKKTQDAGRRRTVFVTLDRNFHLWTAAMNFLFVDREHRVFDNVDAARVFLDEGASAGAPSDDVKSIAAMLEGRLVNPAPLVGSPRFHSATAG